MRGAALFCQGEGLVVRALLVEGSGRFWLVQLLCGGMENSGLEMKIKKVERSLKDFKAARVNTSAVLGSMLQMAGSGPAPALFLLALHKCCSVQGNYVPRLLLRLAEGSC